MFMPEKLTEVSESQLRVAFDGDAVLFSDESERIFKAHGLDKFFEHERENEDTLLDHVCSFHKICTFSLGMKTSENYPILVILTFSDKLEK